MVMKGNLGRTVALLGISAALVSCALILGEGGKFDEQGTGGAKTTSGESTAASISGAPGDTGSTTASDVTSGTSGTSTTSGMITTTSSTSTTMSGPTSTSSTSTASTSSTSTGGGSGCPMNSVQLLSDDFSNPAHTDNLWMATGSGSAKVTGGALVVTGKEEFFSLAYYPIINCHASVMVTMGSGPNANAHLNLKNSVSGNTVQIFANLDSNGYISFNGPSGPLAKNCKYSPTMHRYWRIRATTTDIFEETSSTGMPNDWTSFPCGTSNGEAKRSLALVGFDKGDVEVHLGVDDDGNTTTFDNFNKP